MLRKFVNGKMRLSRGATLLELIIATAVFGFLTLALLGILQFGTRSWRHVESRFQAEKDIRRAVLDINSHLRNTDVATFNSGTSTIETPSDSSTPHDNLSVDEKGITWMAFKTATARSGEHGDGPDILEGQLQYDPEHSSSGIKWTFFLLYYVIPLKSCSACSEFGITDERLCPHKQLVRKWLWIGDKAVAPDLASGTGMPETFTGGRKYIQSGELQEYLTSPSDYKSGGGPFPKLLANNVMNFNVAFYDPTFPAGSWRAPQAMASKPGTVQYTIRCFKQLEATQIRVKEELLKGGNSDVQKRFVEKFTMQIDQGVAPLNNSSSPASP